MRIEEKEIKAVNFGDIRIGECFKDKGVNSNAVYMKINETPTRANAVGLADGFLWSYDCNEKVIQVNAKVVIE